jgi:N-acetylglutamate synthase/N-acetylornithine aminotransferase
VSAKSDLQNYLESILPPGESVAVTRTVQVKGGMKKQLGKSIAKGIAASVAVTAATGGASGLLVVAVPPLPGSW